MLIEENVKLVLSAASERFGRVNKLMRKLDHVSNHGRTAAVAAVIGGHHVIKTAASVSEDRGKDAAFDPDVIAEAEAAGLNAMDTPTLALFRFAREHLAKISRSHTMGVRDAWRNSQPLKRALKAAGVLHDCCEGLKKAETDYLGTRTTRTSNTP